MRRVRVARLNSAPRPRARARARAASLRARPIDASRRRSRARARVVPRVDARSKTCAPHIATRRSRPIARMTRTEVTLAVDFACEGCAASVRRIAERIEGVREVEIDVEAKRCVVRGDALDAEDVLARVRKCGRATTLLME